MATRTWTGATNNNWGTTTNWAEGFIPTNADDVIFSTNANCSVTSAAVCKTINFGTYSGTFLNTGGLTVSGNVTLGTNVVWGTWSANLVVNATATLTSNGKDIPRLQFSNTITVTLADNWTATSVLFFQQASITVTLNGNIIYVSGGTITHSNGCTITGTTAIHITGTVTWTSGTATISNPITINTAGTFTLANQLNLNGNTLTYTSGTMSVSGSTVTTIGSVTITGAGLILNNLSGFTNTTLTLNNALTLNGNLTSSNTTTTFTINGSDINVGGSWNPAVNTTYSGTSKVVLNGTGTWGNAWGAIYKNSVDINTSGTITFSAGTQLAYNTGTLRYIAGTIAFGSGHSGLVMSANTTLDTGGMTWQIVKITAGITLTLNSTLNVSNYLELTSNLSIVFAGTSGFITDKFNAVLSTNRITTTFQAGVEYKITSQLNFKGAIYSARHIFQSSSSTKALITLTSGAYQRTTNVDYTRIDASNGITLWTVEGTITDSINCNTMESYKSTIGTVN